MRKHWFAGRSAGRRPVRRATIGVATLAGSLALLAACGGDGEQQAPAGEQPPGAAEAAAAAEDPSRRQGPLRGIADTLLSGAPSLSCRTLDVSENRPPGMPTSPRLCIGSEGAHIFALESNAQDTISAVTRVVRYTAGAEGRSAFEKRSGELVARLGAPSERCGAGTAEEPRMQVWRGQDRQHVLSLQVLPDSAAAGMWRAALEETVARGIWGCQPQPASNAPASPPA